jgi:hypothetical protein
MEPCDPTRWHAIVELIEVVYVHIVANHGCILDLIAGIRKLDEGYSICLRQCLAGCWQEEMVVGVMEQSVTLGRNPPCPYDRRWYY